MITDHVAQMLSRSAFGDSASVIHWRSFAGDRNFPYQLRCMWDRHAAAAEQRIIQKANQIISRRMGREIWQLISAAA